MKTNIFKRGTSAILALIMCLSAFIGIDTNTAFAVGEQSEAVIISFPRGGDSNYEGAWGHPSLKYMNGWSQESSTYYNIFAVGSFSGNICYCIEPGLTLDTGDSFVSKDESYWDNYPSDYNHTISAYEIKMFIGRIFQYGYTGKVDTNWHSQNAGDADKLSNIIATQLLVWETIVGERDGNFGKVSTGGCNAVLESVSSSHPLYSQIISHYNRISSSVQKHTKVPSFCSKTSSKANTIELEWNGKNYTTVLTDSNGVLNDYTFSANQSCITFSQNGNKLTITAAAAPSSVVNITASKANSQRKGIIVWDDGTYKPGVGKQNLATYAQSVNDPVKGFVNIKVSYGSAKIVKTSDDGNVANLSFTITGNGINKTVKTNSKGEFQIDNLLPGTYTVTEQSYDKYEPQESRRVTVVSGKVATVNFKNKLKRGDVKVIKSSEDDFDECITFHLYGTSLSGLAVDEYALTDKNGVATFKDVPISGKTPYTLEEVNTAFRYVIPEKQTAPVKWKEVTSRNFNNILKKFTATVIKTDIENGTAQGEASLAGAKYGIFQGDKLIDEYYTDQNGQFTTKEYICGDNWTLKELEPSEGYLLDPTVHHIGAEAKLYKVEHNLISVDVNETVIKGKVAIIKHTDNGDTQIETPEKGAEFEVYLKSAGSYANADTNERDVIVCDENGFGQTKDMPYGIYTVHQTKGWEGRELLKDFDVFISKNAQTYRYLINNAEFESYVKVVKLDAETGKNIPYAGAGFQIYDPDGNLVKMTFTYPNPTAIDTFYTDAEGSLVTPEMLPYGKGYSIVEVQAPYGYILDSTPIFFDVTEEHSTKESGVTLIKVNKENTTQKGTFTIEKTGEIFTGVSVIGGIDENENVLPTIYQPQYEVQGLSGAVYEIRAAEDIITPDGTLRISKGEIVDTVTTDETGFAKSKELYLGKYEIKEITAPYGMVLNKDSSIVELVYAGQNISVTEAAVSLNNERQKVEISLEKTLEINEIFGIGSNGEIQNINFGLFAAEDIVSASGTEIPADGLIEIITIDENGKAAVKTDLPIGSYYIQELVTDEHYILSDEKYPVVFEYAGQETAKVVIAANDGEPIENDMFYGSVSGIKSDENGDGLGGALIGLFQTDKEEFT